ncbi:hypothetical protein A5641_05615 [Mycobacterium sp. 1554424.7]|nr:hypothetical protein A5641_05615 [Mycobacterium sp. 1554424.7]
MNSMIADGLAPCAPIVAKKVPALMQRVQHPDALDDFRKRTAAKDYEAATKRGSLILWTLSIVEVLELATGFGPPDAGDEFKDASQQFIALSARLKTAIPEDNWQGSASQDYVELDTTLANSAQTMADLDLRLGALIKNQADWVTHARWGFGALKLFLLMAFFIEVAMACQPPPGGPGPATTFAYASAALGLSAASGMLIGLGCRSHENAQQADDLAAQYGQLRIRCQEL